MQKRWKTTALATIGISLSMASVAPDALAQNGDMSARGQACTAIHKSSARLKCFDKLFPAQKKTPAQADAAPVQESPWQFKTGKSPVDDSVSISASLTTDEASLTGGLNRIGVIGFTCAKGKISATIVTDLPSGLDPVPVTIRINSEKAATSLWQGSGAAALAPSTYDSKALLDSIPAGAKLFVAMAAAQMTFEVGDIDAVRAKLETSCSK